MRKLREVATWLVSSIIVWIRFKEIRIIGDDNIPTDSNFIATSNHVSAIDPAIIWKVIGRVIRFWMKTDILLPLIDPIIVLLGRLLLGSIPVNRRKIRRRPRLGLALVENSVPIVLSGNIVGIFPEGSRKEKKKNDAAYRGAAKLALKTGTPILPIALIGTKGAANPIPLLIHRERIVPTMIIGKLITLENNGSPNRVQENEATELIMTTIRRLEAAGPALL